MRKADRETESRKLIGEKLREARMADNSPMTEADAEYYRILAEARATHASKENTRKSAKKHALTSAAAILLILAVAGGSFILGMQSDVRASADPDDERKVVQQGDNIVIGSGVSEDDERIGMRVKVYTQITDVPEQIVEDIPLSIIREYDFKRLKIVENQNGELQSYSVTAIDNDGREVVITVMKNVSDINTLLDVKEITKTTRYGENVLCEAMFDNGKLYLYQEKDLVTILFFEEELIPIKIEAFINDLQN